jgi:hypothetical protein
LVFLVSGCDRLVSEASERAAPWSYVEEAWGGIGVGKPVVSADGVTIPFDLGLRPPKRLDSAICVRDADARLKDGRIVVLLERGVCGPGSPTEHAVHLKRLPKGTYTVVYGDADAGYPVIGEVIVE